MTGTLNKSRLPRLRSQQEAVDYFKTHQRTRGKDLQVQRAQTLSWNCDGSRLVVGSNDKRISVLQVDNSYRLTSDFTATTHEGSVDQVAFQPNGAYVFASASDDKSICIWDVRHPKKHTKISTKVPNLYVTYSACGRYVIYMGKDDKIHIIDGRSLGVLKTHDLNREGCEFACHPNGKFLFVATGTGKIEVLSVPNLEPVQTIQAHSAQSTLTTLNISRDGSRLAVGGNDAMVTIWDLESMTGGLAMPRMDYSIRSLSFSGDGTLLATGSEDHFIDFSWSNDGQKVADLALDCESYYISWHPRSLVLAYTCSGNDSRSRGNDIGLYGLSHN